MKNILVIQTSFIGDAILVTSVIESLHENHPKAFIDIVVRKGSESIFNNHPFLRNIIVWDKQNAKYKGLFSIAKSVRKRKYDLIVNPHRFASSGFICAYSSAKSIVGFDKNPLSFFYSKTVKHSFNGLHETERNHSLIETFVADKKPSKPRLYPSETDNAKVLSYKKTKYRCIAPTSVWHTKQWPNSKWIEFIDTLPKDENVYLIGGPFDRSACDEIMTKSMHPNIFNLAGELTLLQSAALFKDAIMNYVNDSGPMHLCSAVNANTTAIFCSTVPSFGFGPLADQSRIVESMEELNCRPCGIHGHKACPKGHFKCALSISVNQVAESHE